MRSKLAILTVLACTMCTLITSTGSALAQSGKQPNKSQTAQLNGPIVFKATNKWIQKYSRIDQSIYTSIAIAAPLFGVSQSLLIDIIEGEGGNVNPTTLSESLCLGYGKGWNYTGNPPSAAFGAFQFMLKYRGACYNHDAWGTFACCDYAAFKQAKDLGLTIPYRFKNPASNLGQAITAAYMIANPSTGGLCHWGRC